MVSFHYLLSIVLLLSGIPCSGWSMEDTSPYLAVYLQIPLPFKNLLLLFLWIWDRREELQLD